jgi:hypothetical protein
MIYKSECMGNCRMIGRSDDDNKLKNRLYWMIKKYESNKLWSNKIIEYIKLINNTSYANISIIFLNIYIYNSYVIY